MVYLSMFFFEFLKISNKKNLFSFFSNQKKFRNFRIFYLFHRLSPHIFSIFLNFSLLQSQVNDLQNSIKFIMDSVSQTTQQLATQQAEISRALYSVANRDADLNRVEVSGEFEFLFILKDVQKWKRFQKIFFTNLKLKLFQFEHHYLGENHFFNLIKFIFRKALKLKILIYFLIFRNSWIFKKNLFSTIVNFDVRKKKCFFFIFKFKFFFSKTPFINLFLWKCLQSGISTIKSLLLSQHNFAPIVTPSVTSSIPSWQQVRFKNWNLGKKTFFCFKNFEKKLEISIVKPIVRIQSFSVW